MHSTNKAFERYFQMERNDLRAIYNNTKIDQGLIKGFQGHENRNALKFKAKIGGADGT